MKNTLRLALFAAACTSIVLAVQTRTWSQSEQADYEKATLKGVALRSDGLLTVAPQLKDVYDPSVPYLWSVVQDSKGNIYSAGGGSGGSTVSVYKTDTAGRGSKFADLEGLEIQSLAIDSKDRLFAATSPNGKVWQITTNGSVQPFYDPKATYIWGLVTTSNGTLFVATGDQGEIHKVSPDGKGSVFYKMEDAHARSIAADAKENLYIGTEPSGVVLRVTPKGEGFILHQTSKREVTAIRIGSDGIVYAAATGTKQGPTVVPTAPAATAAAKPAAGTAQSGAPATPAAPPILRPAGVGIGGGSEIVRIDADGAPHTIWQHATDVAYSLGFDESGKLLIGTGNKGSIYRVDSAVNYTLLTSSTLGQVTGFTTPRQGIIYAVTGNVGKVLQLGPGLEAQGTVESEVFDAGSFSYWGRIHLDSVANGASVTIETRSGNVDRPQKSWSAWQPLKDSGITSPAARFLQWRATMKPAGAQSPAISGIDVAWMAKNIAPRVEAVEATPANYRFPAPATSITSSSRTLSLPPLGRRSRSASSSSSSSDSSVILTYAKGSAGIRWSAGDDNDDTLVYKVEIRGVAETTFKLLKENIRERFVTFDSTAFPDGEYVARITASDAPDNIPGETLSGDLVSASFLVDNTPPAITNLGAQPSGNQLRLNFHAADALNWIARAEYSINGGEWTVIHPKNRLSDAKELDYSVLLDRPQPGEISIAVRVTDDFDNQSVNKVVVK